MDRDDIRLVEQCLLADESGAGGTGVCTESLNPEVVVMESAEDGERF